MCRKLLRFAGKGGGAVVGVDANSKMALPSGGKPLSKFVDSWLFLERAPMLENGGEGFAVVLYAM